MPKRIAKSAAPPNPGPLKTLLTNLKKLRAEKDDLVNDLIPAAQKEALAALQVIDPEGNGVVFEFDGQEIAGYYQQNDATEYWDAEEVIAFLKKRKSLWMACSSRVFDPAKFEAEIANGNIPAKTVRKFKKTGTPPAPFVRMGKPKKESIR
jgi:hypothetical protein